MRELPAGKIGTVDVRLAPQSGQTPRYERRYVPVTPASREIVGSDDKVAPDSTVAEWHIDDWSAGEGDLRWRDSGRFNESDGMGPVSDGSGVTVNAYVEATEASGGGAFANSRVFGRRTTDFVTADDSNGDLYFFDQSADAWDTYAENDLIDGSGTDDVKSIAMGSASVFISDATYEIHKYGETAHNPHHSSFTSIPWLTSFNGVLYAAVDCDLYSIDQTAKDTDTLLVDLTGSSSAEIAGRQRWITTSDVGPIWLVPKNDGRTFLYEYNVADDVGYVVGELPRDIYAYDLWFHAGIYFVSFRYGAAPTYSGDAYLYYQVGGQRGVAGPLRSHTGTTASKAVMIGGVVGDRLYLYYDTAAWAYDLSSGGISMVARDLDSTVTNFAAYGPDLFYSTGTSAYRINLAEYDTDVDAELTTGRYDFGYLGLYKTLTTVTVTCESALAASETVGVSYAVDGGSYTALSGTMGVGETTKTWTVSTNASTVRGLEFEFKILAKANTAASSPKVVSMTAEAIGSESRLEWVLRIDVADSNEQSGATVLDGLKALKTAHAVVEFTDPWQVLPATADEAFDVTVEEAYLPDAKAGADAVATVRLRTVATV